jgi:ABC-type sulfate transport system substrate-binding protein
MFKTCRHVSFINDIVFNVQVLLRDAKGAIQDFNKAGQYTWLCL